jgi:transposase
MLVAWRHLRVQVAAFDKAIRAMARTSAAARLLMSVPGIGMLSALAYVSTVEDPSRFSRSRSVAPISGLRHVNTNRAKSIEAAEYRGVATSLLER